MIYILILTIAGTSFTAGAFDTAAECAVRAASIEASAGVEARCEVGARL